MKDKLNLLPIRHERISIKDFGTTDSKTEEIEIVKFKVNDINKKHFCRSTGYSNHFFHPNKSS